jgi:Raf kinase inhibitor-like YbhB/YbcL family protein
MRGVEMMKVLTGIVAIIAAVAYLTAAQADAKTALALKSDAFPDGGSIPQENSYNASGCTGKNASPELHWSGAPKGTKSFALTVFDPDANNGGGWWHWVVYGIDRGTEELAEGEPFPGLVGKTSFGNTGYGGPCPPPGDQPHHYIFTLYALDETLGGSLDGPQLVKAVKGHVLGKAVLVGRFGR